MTDTPKQRRRVALTTSVQDKIVLLIEGWKPEWGKFSGSALERKVASCLGIPCTRQGLLKKDRIKDAFDERMKLKGKQPKAKSAEVTVIEQRNERLKSQLDERDTQVEHLQELVTRFRFNAKNMGIPVERLEQPIAPLTGKRDNG